MSLNSLHFQDLITEDLLKLISLLRIKLYIPMSTTTFPYYICVLPNICFVNRSGWIGGMIDENLDLSWQNGGSTRFTLWAEEGRPALVRK